MQPLHTIALVSQVITRPPPPPPRFESRAACMLVHPSCTTWQAVTWPPNERHVPAAPVVHLSQPCSPPLCIDKLRTAMTNTQGNFPYSVTVRHTACRQHTFLLCTTLSHSQTVQCDSKLQPGAYGREGPLPSSTYTRQHCHGIAYIYMSPAQAVFKYGWFATAAYLALSKGTILFHDSNTGMLLHNLTDRYVHYVQTNLLLNPFVQQHSSDYHHACCS